MLRHLARGSHPEHPETDHQGYAGCNQAAQAHRLSRASGVCGLADATGPARMPTGCARVRPTRSRSRIAGICCAILATPSAPSLIATMRPSGALPGTPASSWSSHPKRHKRPSRTSPDRARRPCASRLPWPAARVAASTRPGCRRQAVPSPASPSSSARSASPSVAGFRSAAPLSGASHRGPKCCPVISLTLNSAG